MKYKKLSEMNFSIFAELEKIANELEIFKYSTGAELDNVFNFKYSERLVNPLCETKSSADVAQMVKVLCSYTWDNYIKYMVNMTPTNTTTTTEQRTETPTETTVNTNKISAYNASEFADNEETTTTRNGNTDIASTNTVTTNNLSNSRSIFNIFTNLAFYDKIFLDVINVIALNIY